MLSRDQAIWDDVLDYVRDQVSETEFRTWFKQVRPLGISEGVFQLGVPHSFARDWIRSHFGTVLEQALRDLGAPSPTVGFQVVTFAASEQPDMFSQPATTPASAPPRERAALNPK